MLPRAAVTDDAGWEWGKSWEGTSSYEESGVMWPTLVCAGA